MIGSSARKVQWLNNLNLCSLVVICELREMSQLVGGSSPSVIDLRVHSISKLCPYYSRQCSNVTCYLKKCRKVGSKIVQKNESQPQHVIWN